MVRKDILEMATPYYADIPYHNHDHHLHVMEECDKLIHRCQKHGILVNEDVIYFAAGFHDAGFDRTKDNKELLAARIASNYLQYLGRPDLCDPVTHAILATHYDVAPTTIEAKILAAADLRSLMGEYAHFREGTHAVLEKYLQQDIHLTPEAEDDRFHERARDNMQWLLSEF